MDYHSLNAAIKICAFWVAFVPLFYTLSQSHKKRLQHFSFLILAIAVAGQSLFGVAREFFSIYLDDSDASYALLFVFETATRICNVAFITGYAFYIMVTVHVFTKSNRLLMHLFWVPAYVLAVFYLINPFNKWFFDFTYDPIAKAWVFDFKYGFGALIIHGVIYAIVAATFFGLNLKNLPKRKAWPLCFFNALSVTGIVYGVFFSKTDVQYIAEAVVVTCMLIWLETDGTMLDFRTGFYNRTAFLGDNEMSMKSRQKYKIIGITLSNYDSIRRAFGEDLVNNLVTEVSGQIKKHVYRTSPYYLGRGRFAFYYYEKDEDEINEYLEELKNVLSQDWQSLSDNPAQTSWLISLASIPDEINTVTGLYDLFSETNEDADVKIRRGKDFAFIARKNDVMAAFKRGLADNNFEVHFQPIWDAYTNKVVTAEALIRLNDPILGRVSPTEFIPIAEANGAIKAIGEFVFREACRFYKKANLENEGLDFVCVNVSVHQLQQDDLAEHFIRIAKEEGVDVKHITLEITESENAESNPILLNQIIALGNAGFKLSLDDYGTGYANLARLTNSDFTSIKMDRSLLLNSTTEKGKRLLKESISIMKGFGFNVVQEGVETKEQLEEVISYGADMIQGYYFSCPVPEEEFLRTIRSINNERKA